MGWYIGDENYPVQKVIYNGSFVALLQGSIVCDNVYQIDMFEVFKELRGNHIGSNIIKLLIEDSKEEGIVFVVYPRNIKAAAFWEYCGFIKENDGTGTDIWINRNR
jgi:ribosomal protein S18 acetylase RimI-like enzyme